MHKVNDQILYVGMESDTELIYLTKDSITSKTFVPLWCT